jgi:hypothetical protein
MIKTKKKVVKIVKKTVRKPMARKKGIERIEEKDENIEEKPEGFDSHTMEAYVEKDSHS